MIRIVPVEDVRPHWPGMARIMCDAWPGWYGPGGSGDAMADLRGRSGPGMPRGWIAMDGDHPVATVGIAATSYGATGDEGPWLIGLVTAPAMRGRGIGAAMIAHVETAIPAPIFTTTREAAPLFLRRGWRDMRDVEDGWRVLRHG